ncbi:DoxX family protein [Deinococcus sp.]|uniref:DoxX family protein n=1 Tax=Deinococcus sp. TaxID=47478 RepID=UPI003CC66BA3
MNILLWALQVLLGLLFIGSGGAKLAQPKEQMLKSPQMGWASDFSQGTIRLIGLAEVLGGLGLILPAALKVLPVLTPLAALGLAAIMFGAVMTHAGRREPFVPALVLALLALVVCAGRFWLAPIA